jgi:hypothetical protein
MGSYKLENTPSGEKTLIYTDSNTGRKQYRLHSAYNPLKESERAVESFNSGRSSLIIVAGVALGYHLRYLKEKYPGHLIIAIEKHPEIINIVEKTYPDNIEDIYIINSSNDLTSVFEEIAKINR